jgi:arylsulfatase A-like enzyme
MRSSSSGHLLPSLAAACGLVLSAAVSVAVELPHFIVPGHEPEMRRLEELHALHHPGAFSHCTLWDAWLPHATLWTGPGPRDRYRRTLLGRRIDAEGYVSMQQHRGLAHSEGWPFPTWPQAGGKGWHFSVAHDGWAQKTMKIQPLTAADGWEIEGADVGEIDPARGLLLTATDDTVSITTPAFRCAAFVAPFLRIEWAATGIAADATAEVTWLRDGETDWQPTRAVAVDPPAAEMRYANVPLHRHAEHGDTITRYAITLRGVRGGEIALKSLITAIDTRHPITNPLFVIGAADYACWTGDREFLREVIGPLRRAVAFAIEEFDVAAGAHVHVGWVGHDGRTGLGRDAAGKKQLLRGHGVGNNYWDLLPFGGHDALATMMLHAALGRMAELEAAIAAHPEWEIPAVPAAGDAAALGGLADRIRADFQTRFWNAETGRFVGWIDEDGTPWDYGFTFLNLEAIARGLASPEQARTILDWIDGHRTVAGDTAQGDDIYHWRFGPRSTTRRNVETYMWAWAGPESIPWGGQVQDGGAVLGFSYYDLLARLDTRGPDDAWQRLREILAWCGEVQEAGGYRAYYAVPGRGTLQGGGTAGGLGFDHEFMESVLVPQVMLSGFLGFRPTPDGFALAPRLPSDWPSLKITGIHVHDHVLDIQAFADGRVLVQPVRAGVAPLAIEHARTRHVLETQGRPLLLGGPDRAAARRPNILFVFTEDQGAHMGCLGTPAIETPHMDALAASGTLFRTAWVGYPVCSASKACLLTGLPTVVNGLLNNTRNQFKHASRLTADELADVPYRTARIHSPGPTLVECLVAAGYYAGIAGKLHVAPNERFPYHEFLGPDGGRQIVNFAARADAAGRPWFLFHNAITHTHRPFRNSDIEPIGVDPRDVRLPGFLPDTPVARQDWAEYLDGVERNDVALGRLLAQLEETGVADRTIVVFMGDHGPAFPHGKMTPYDLALHVPLVIRLPGASPGVSDALVQAIDLLPTLLDATGIEPVAGLPGRSLVPLLRGEDTPGDNLLFATVTGRHFGAARGMEERTVRDHRHHLIARARLDEPRSLNADSIRWPTWRCRIHDEIVRERERHPEPYRILAEHLPGSLGGRPPPLECYDLEQDPDELHDLMPGFERGELDPAAAAAIERLHAALGGWAAANDDERFTLPPLPAPRGSVTP